ncbi:MAG: phospholipase D-like domain-containing protein, partial [Elusimicrobiales bacterium]|nr:phospholipase D-like domain-containing protein [Elusimicrobiales bacterium]
IEYTKVQTSKVDPAITKLINANVPIRLLKGGGLYGIMHNKITLIDSSILITGSYNFTINANINNYENIVFLDNQSDINSYKNYFETMWSRATDISYPSKSLSIPSDVPTALLTMINSIRANIIKMINYSKKTIDIAVYSISDDDIFNTLVNAKNRGVKIRIVTDRLQSTQSATVKKLYDAGFDIKISDGFNKGMMHNKYAIFDNSIVITGSFNWSNNAETYNWENAVLLPSIYAAYFSRNFATIYNQAKPYDGKTSNAGETPISR